MIDQFKDFCILCAVYALLGFIVIDKNQFCLFIIRILSCSAFQ